MEENKRKKDLKPIWLYIIFQFIFPAIISFVTGIVMAMRGLNVTSMLSSNRFIYLISLLSTIVTFVVLIAIYRKKFRKDFKKLSKRTLIILIIATTIVIILNKLIFDIFEKFNIETKNQNLLKLMFAEFPALTAISTLLAAFIEELVFRYAIKNLIKNKIVFIIISSIIFGISHGIGIATILYVLIGLFLGIVYIKTDENVASSTIAHFLNNLCGIVLIIFE